MSGRAGSKLPCKQQSHSRCTSAKLLRGTPGLVSWHFDPSTHIFIPSLSFPFLTPLPYCLPTHVSSLKVGEMSALPPLVMLHGLLGSGNNFRTLCTSLHQATQRQVRY